ncbi:MAG: FtsQ-type POTRA domain-containing protein [Succinivibrio sp.]|nr:FtsQ-type POTRA domain-containing protein [Succinivibrio sp.]
MKKQTRGRFYCGLLFAALLTFLVLKGDTLLMDFLSSSNALPIRAVEIDGALKELSKKEIVELAGRHAAGRNLASFETAPLQNALLQLPWVAQAVIRKKMPDKLIISLVEHVPAAYWNERGLYDARTQSVFYPDLENFHASLVRLGAVRDNLAPEVYALAVQLHEVLRGSGLQMVKLHLDQVRCYTLTLRNGTRLILGRDRQKAAQRLKRFVLSWQETGLNLDEADYVDLRYEVGFAVGHRKDYGEKGR